MNIQAVAPLSEVWKAAGVLMGVQLAAASWRFTREVSLAKEAQITRLIPADYLNLMSLLIAATGCFVLPILGRFDALEATKSLGLSVVLFAGYPFAVAGHYELYNPSTKYSYRFTNVQEIVAIVVCLLCASTYVIMAFFCK